MKKKILTVTLGVGFFITGTLSFSLENADAYMLEEAVSKSGKWIGVYQGGETIKYCECVSSFWKSKCLVGDVTSSTSKCN